MLTPLYYLLKQRWILITLLIINFLGTIYGYYWYRFQLAATPPKFLVFVPDSPTASLFFCFVLFAFIFRKNFPFMEALAVMTLFKYGVWAVGMNIASDIMGYPYSGLLIFSHACMAIEGVLYAPFYRIKPWHFVIAAIWTLHNDFIDYIFHVMPWYNIDQKYTGAVGYITFWLSVISVLLVYYLAFKKKKKLDITY